MVDMSHSPTPNGYHRASPCSSPGVMATKGMARQSPPIHGRPPPSHPGPPRLMVPDGRSNMINSEVHNSISKIECSCYNLVRYWIYNLFTNITVIVYWVYVEFN